MSSISRPSAQKMYCSSPLTRFWSSVPKSLKSVSLLSNKSFLIVRHRRWVKKMFYFNNVIHQIYRICEYKKQGQVLMELQSHFFCEQSPTND